MDKHISTLLDQALTRLEAGERVEAILIDYPSRAHELAPLLATAQELTLMRSVPPPPDLEAGLAAFLEQAEAMRPKPSGGLGRRLTYWLTALKSSPLYPKARLALGTLAALLLLFGLLGGVMLLTADSLPGDPLYPVKLAGEEIRLSLIHEPSARAAYLLTRVQVRVEEMRQIAETGRPLDETSLARLNQSLDACLLAAASTSPGETRQILAAIESSTAQQADVLASVEEMVISQNTRQVLSQARHSLIQAHSLARDGQADWYTFRLNAILGTFQIGWPATAFDATTH